MADVHVLDAFARTVDSHRSQGSVQISVICKGLFEMLSLLTLGWIYIC